MPTSIREEDRCWSEMLASSYTHYREEGGQTPATLILGAYCSSAGTPYFRLRHRMPLSAILSITKNVAKSTITI